MILGLTIASFGIVCAVAQFVGWFYIRWVPGKFLYVPWWFVPSFAGALLSVVVLVGYRMWTDLQRMKGDGPCDADSR